MSVWTIVVAAGSGSRFGAEKQFMFAGGKRVIDHSIETALECSDGVVVVVSESRADFVVPERDLSRGNLIVVCGGATRAQSVRNGLAAVPGNASVILVHDAARPLASKALYESVITAVEQGADCAIPGIPVSDTVKRVVRGDFGKARMVVTETVERSELVAAQTPQAFRAALLREVHAASPEASDDAGLVEASGRPVVVVPGEHANLKITLPIDLNIVDALCAESCGDDNE